MADHPKMTATDTRPDPDALLAAARREGRGRLRIFLGAAPGVGKTYAMLSGAARLAREGRDVVIGVVETHGRAETGALLAGLEILPRKLSAYRGAQLAEFDLDAALLRRPGLIIVDELAHTNAPESRHPKRYLDVLELIGAGIDVWTAVNIQHLEGLSDVVSRITGVTIRETVPDTILDQADEVVVVDITPAELITRLQNGKIYLPDNARRAADGFFKPGNLTALRELALRRTAERVDDQMVDHLREHAIEGAWPTAERLLVCVGADASSKDVVRSASRLATGLNAPWTAVTLERPGADIAEAARRRIDEALALAERLGAETARLSGRDLVAEIIRYARRENITQIVIGRSAAGFWARLRGRSLSDALMRRVSDIAVHVIVGDQPQASSRWRRPDVSRLWVGGLAAIVSVSVAVGLGLIATHYVKLPNLSMLFLAAVLMCAVSLGVWSAITAALLSFLAYNFFFIPPIYTFTIAEPHELLALLIFLLVAVLTGGLAGRVRDQSNAAYRRVATIQALFDISRKLSGTASLDDVLWVLARQAAAAVKGQVLILLPEGSTGPSADLSIRAAFPPEDEIAPGDWAAARWAFEKGETAGWRTGTLPNARLRFMPVRTSRGVVGVVGFEPADRARDMSAEDERGIAALVDQGAIAIERALLVADAQRGEALAERERLQATLLSSLSHDLRTPLASILGAATSLRNFGGQMPQADRDDLLATIEEETGRLSRFVSNLLDMTRVESGSLQHRRDWIDIPDVVSNAVKRARKTFPNRAIEVAVPANLPPVRGEPALLEQVVFNLLDNADKYSPAGLPTIVRASLDGAMVVLTIEDQGRGIPPGDLERVFEKFTRLDSGDGRAAGTGLGLAIARGVIEAQGGTIRAESPARGGRGTRIVIKVAVSEPPPQAAEPEEARAGVAADSRR